MRIIKAVGMFLLLIVAGAAGAAPAGWAPLLEPAELERLLSQSNGIRVIQVTGDYAAGHIPGSLHAPYAEFRGPQDNAGQLPPAEALTALVQRLGISADTPVAIVHQGNAAVDMGASTRVYWTLKSLGVQDLAVLNGGFAAWQSAGLAVSTEASTVASSSFVPTWSEQWTVHTAEVEQLVADGSARLIDGRPAPFFEGTQSTAARAGTIKGAENLSFASFFDNTTMKSANNLSSVLDAASVNGQDDLTVAFCNTGQMGSINWFVMSELAGMDNVKLYAESIVEWAQSPDRPMDNQP
ncbi:MAG: rhodanese-like domain-containing protein [Pseudohongiella sp.]|nr:rhodanese-like domain-containing protein [Pseudohongiella sp.]MDO9521275.1 rhodanese-like domain-containing protein [Pseudohongiella sp.]